MHDGFGLYLKKNIVIQVLNQNNLIQCMRGLVFTFFYALDQIVTHVDVDADIGQLSHWLNWPKWHTHACTQVHACTLNISKK